MYEKLEHPIMFISNVPSPYWLGSARFPLSCCIFKVREIQLSGGDIKRKLYCPRYHPDGLAQWAANADSEAQAESYIKLWLIFQYEMNIHRWNWKKYHLMNFILVSYVRTMLNMHIFTLLVHVFAVVRDSVISHAQGRLSYSQCSASDENRRNKVNG